MSRLVRTLVKVGFGVMVAVVLLAALAFIPPAAFLPQPWSQLPPAPDFIAYAIFWIGSLAAVAFALRNFQSERIGIAIGATAWLFMIYFFVFAMPAGDAFRSEKPFAARVRTLIGSDSSGLILFRNQGPVFYLDLPQPIPEYEKLADLNNVVGSANTHWLIIRRRDLGLLKFASTAAAAETVFPWESKEHGLNAMVLLRVTPRSAP
jgi:hypothetical protein